MNSNCLLVSNIGLEPLTGFGFLLDSCSDLCSGSLAQLLDLILAWAQAQAQAHVMVLARGLESVVMLRQVGRWLRWWWKIVAST